MRMKTERKYLVDVDHRTEAPQVIPIRGPFRAAIDRLTLDDLRHVALGTARLEYRDDKEAP